MNLAILVACSRVETIGPRGPGSLENQAFNLEGVSYRFAVADPASEPPLHVPELWLYARFHRGPGPDIECELGLKLFSVGDTGRRSRVEYPWGDPDRDPCPLGPLRFPHTLSAASVPIRLVELVFPRRGLYEFRLLRRKRRPTWKGSRWVVMGSHYIDVR